MSGLAGFDGHLVTASFLAKCCTAGALDDQAHARWRTAANAVAAARTVVGPASSVRTLLDLVVAPLLAALEFESIHDTTIDRERIAGTAYGSGRGAALLVVPWGERFESHWRTAVLEARRRASVWCLLCNGTHLRVIDATQVYARRFVECELAIAIDRAETFQALARVAGMHALCAKAESFASLHHLVAGSDRDAAGVCRSLRDGVLSASSDVLRALIGPRQARVADRLDDTFEQSLTIVYRVLFLLFAEARSLVPMWHPVYRDSYSVDALRHAAERPSARGLWDTLRAMARLAHAGCRAGDLRVTPFNGRLFAPSRAPLAERRDLDDEAARRAVLSLTTRPSADRAGRERIVYRDLGVEQLGAVYETLLDYRPHVTPSPLSVSLRRGSNVRKATGTFYTPQPLADYLVRRTLAPLVQDVSSTDILKVRIVDPAMGSGAFLVAACRYLANAYELALVAEGGCHPSDLGERDRAGIRRVVAERCLYGVDLNPMAVQLARLSLWLATLAADRPLSFLDHRLVSGDSLLGAWLRQLAQPPVPGRRRRTAALPLFPENAMSAALGGALPVRFSLELPSDTVEAVREKERALTALTRPASPLGRWKQIADVWCASWFATPEQPVPAVAYTAIADTLAAGSGALPERLSRTYQTNAAAIAGERRFFHWELEFPEVFFDEQGGPRPRPGFDAVIGNPPWDMMRADAGAANLRARDRAGIEAAVRFARDSGAYAAQSDGHANRYQLFIERAIALTRTDGRIGLVLPAGLAMDHGSAPLRRHVLQDCDVDAIVGVDNHRGIFPIHRSVRFLLLTATAGRATEQIRCRFGVESTQALEAMADDDGDVNFPLRLTPTALERFSGASLAIPYLRDAIDLQIIERAAARFPALGADAGWRARFGRELNATDDRASFRAAGQGWPVVDGKHLEPFAVAANRSERSIAGAEARRLLGDRVEKPRLAYRDVASATNRQTLIAAVLPARTASTHTVFCLRTPLALRDQHLLCAIFNSFVGNYLVRQRVTTHVTTAIVEHLPIPTRDMAPAACRELERLARLLARRRDPSALARLNAAIARLYQLTAEEFNHVLGTFPLFPDTERRAAMADFLEG